MKKGDNANLACSYDMEGDSLYSVKWYKGRREFYRYTPKENPSMKVFHQTGITVDVSLYIHLEFNSFFFVVIICIIMMMI